MMAALPSGVSSAFSRMIAEAPVASRYRRYFLLLKKVRSPGCAFSIGATLVMLVSWSPTNSQFNLAASSLIFIIDVSVKDWLILP
jgi:hypothetical protein